MMSECGVCEEKERLVRIIGELNAERIEWKSEREELRAMCNELGKLLLDYSGSCPFDFYESKSCMPCEFDHSNCNNNENGECWVAYAKKAIQTDEDKRGE